MVDPEPSERGHNPGRRQPARLLKAPDELKNLIISRKINPGHVKVHSPHTYQIMNAAPTARTIKNNSRALSEVHFSFMASPLNDKDNTCKMLLDTI